MPVAHAEELTFFAPKPKPAAKPEPKKKGAFNPYKHVPKVPGEAEYKVVRLREMYAQWKGTKLETRAVPLLAMLIEENGALSEAVRGDHGLAIGLEQNHICNRGFMGKIYCGKGALKKFKKALAKTPYPDYLTSWQTQFRHYTDTVLGMTEDGFTTDGVIRSWNANESGRRGKVRDHEEFVRLALGLP